MLTACATPDSELATVPPVVAPSPAVTTPCPPRDFVLGQLAQRYGEAPIAFGVTSTGGLVEVLSNGNTWTIIVSMPDGTSCMVAAGEGWRSLERVVEGPET